MAPTKRIFIAIALSHLLPIFSGCSLVRRAETRCDEAHHRGSVPLVGRENPPPGSTLTRPEKIFHETPTYTDAAREAEIQGVVIVRSIIDRNGTTTPLKVVKSLPMGLDRAAMETVKGWLFTPARVEDQPVDICIDLVVIFRLALPHR